MGNYRMRKERQRLRRRMKDTIAQCKKDMEYERATCDRKLHEAQVELGRNRYERVVHWDTNMRVAFEREIEQQPYIKLTLIAKRMKFDAHEMKSLLGHRRDLEYDVAREITRYIIEADLVSFDLNEVPSREPFVREYDFGLYVGTPVPKRAHQRV